MTLNALSEHPTQALPSTLTDALVSAAATTALEPMLARLLVRADDVLGF